MNTDSCDYLLLKADQEASFVGLLHFLLFNNIAEATRFVEFSPPDRKDVKLRQQPYIFEETHFVGDFWLR